MKYRVWQVTVQENAKRIDRQKIDCYVSGNKYTFVFEIHIKKFNIHICFLIFTSILLWTFGFWNCEIHICLWNTHCEFTVWWNMFLSPALVHVPDSDRICRTPYSKGSVNSNDFINFRQDLLTSCVSNTVTTLGLTQYYNPLWTWCRKKSANDFLLGRDYRYHAYAHTLQFLLISTRGHPLQSKRVGTQFLFALESQKTSTPVPFKKMKRFDLTWLMSEANTRSDRSKVNLILNVVEKSVYCTKCQT